MKVNSLTNFPHHLHPQNTLFLNGNDNDDEEEDKFSPLLGVKSTYPQKLHMPTNVNEMVEENIVIKLVKQKQNYINKVTKLTANYKRASKFKP